MPWILPIENRAQNFEIQGRVVNNMTHWPRLHGKMSVVQFPRGMLPWWLRTYRPSLVYFIHPFQSLSRLDDGDRLNGYLISKALASSVHNTRREDICTHSMLLTLLDSVTVCTDSLATLVSYST